MKPIAPKTIANFPHAVRLADAPRDYQVPSFIADVRFSTTFPANSAAALHGASKEYGAREALLHAIFSDVDDADPLLYFVPPYAPEYLALQYIPWEDWYYRFVIESRYSPPDILQEILDIDAIERLWIYIDAPSRSIDKVVSVMVSQTDDSHREKLVAISRHPLQGSSYSDGLLRCDPSGDKDFILVLPGSSSTAVERASKPRFSPYHRVPSDFLVQSIP